MLASCAPTRYVTVQQTQRDSIYLSSLRVDSVLVHDSTVIAQRGDTVYNERVRYVRDVKRYVDTVYSARVDSIPYPVTVEVEKRLSFWGKTKLKLGGIALALCVVCVVWGKRT